MTDSHAASPSPLRAESIEPVQLTDADWFTYRNYADRVTVIITPVDQPVNEHEATEGWVIESGGSAWDQDWLVREVYLTRNACL